VFSTLHTNDAAGAVTRLIDMGVEPYLIASTLEGVLAQRLVRRVCPHCRAACALDEPTRAQLGPDPAGCGATEMTAWRGQGCAHCGHTGYRGRRGIFEWLRITDPIRELITTNAPASVLRQTALAQGMRTLRDDGVRAVLAGETTADEVVRYT
jgi:type IV pilus assembly protein PilB